MGDSIFAQLAVAGLVNGSYYGLLGIGFGLILGVTGRFHYAYALCFTLAAYVAATVIGVAPAPVALLAGLTASVILGVAIEAAVYRPLAAHSGRLSLLTILISSLGLTIAGVSVITLIWTSNGRPLTIMPVRPLDIGGPTFTTLDLLLVCVAWVSAISLDLLMRRSPLGRMIRAVRGNPELARTMGIPPERIFLMVFAVGSVLCGLAGILHGARFAVQPEMGTRAVVFAFVVAFLGGTRSPALLVAAAGLMLGLIESLSGLLVKPQWSALVVFSVLFGYLVLRPLNPAVAIMAAFRRRGRSV